MALPYHDEADDLQRDDLERGRTHVKNRLGGKMSKSPTLDDGNRLSAIERLGEKKLGRNNL